LWSNEYGGNIINIDELYIEKKYRSKGIGTDFIKYLVSSNLNTSVAIQLEVLSTNNKARKFYEKIGFLKSQNDYYFLDFSKKE
jgi:ribosomal protein S18 acetylase RimI-like enzyme